MEWIAQADTQLAVSIRTPFLLVRMLKKKKQPVGPAHVALGNNRAMVLQRARACLHVWEKQKAPLLKNGAFSGEARIYALMAQMVLDKRGRICKSDIETTLAHYAAYGALTLQEAMLVRPAVELALFELLRLALQEDEKDGQEQKTARFFARKLEGKHAGGWLQTALFYARHGGLAFAHYLQQEAKRCPPHIYSQACDNTALPLGTSAQQIGDLYAEQRQARQELVHHIVQSLQGLAQQTQTTWLTLASPAAALLWQETDFTLQDEATQARLYVQIASMAQKSGHSERTVVRTAQRLCVQYGCPFCHLFFGEQQKMLYDRLHLRMRASHTKRYKWL